MPRNIELKVPFVLTDSRRETLRRLGARSSAALVQTDTYFTCSSGRLKLREIIETLPNGAVTNTAELIAYQRADDIGFRGSDYTVSPVPNAASMKAVLASALGVRVVVRKRRELLLWENVRIHLDDVDGLGSFLEFEAVLNPSAEDPAADEAASQQRLVALCDALAIDPAATIAGSYSDMLG
ncbi:class IV adenylate cyclase [Humisphaera borealis]|uniref:Class IV adenylate cyclase n=1 Tax=Humisphaera borealis TaxID=2807512 RepID=A0A7M2WT11_9BACT|nr:class IV adenylate cyclase [Humisphaera borealis]QOV88665.1 class IV adenylate cyclase [Humisphaera borealis]